MSGSSEGGPENALALKQLRAALEAAITALPAEFRLVFVMRDVEGLSTEDVSQALDVPSATIKTRLLRARRRLREALASEVQTGLAGVFPFAGASCEAMTEAVVARICGPQP